MTGIIISINPIALRFGGFELRWYSIAIILAIVAGTLIAAREANRKGLKADDIYFFMPWVLAAGLIGARLLHVIDHWDYYATNPAQIIQLQQGGLAIWGGLITGVIAVAIYAKVKHIPLGLFTDTLVPAILSAQIIGRVGCIINGDAYGGATTLPWGFIYTHPDALIPSYLVGVPTHPYPVYEMVWNVLILSLVLRFRNKITQNGLLFLSYLAFYSIGRFMLSFVRQEIDTLWGLQQAQVLAIAMLITSGIAIYYLLRKSRHNTISKYSKPTS